MSTDKGRPEWEVYRSPVDTLSSSDSEPHKTSCERHSKDRIIGLLSVLACGVVIAAGIGIAAKNNHGSSETPFTSPSVPASKSPVNEGTTPSASESTTQLPTPSATSVKTPDQSKPSTIAISLPPIPPLNTLNGKVGYEPYNDMSGVIWGHAIFSSQTNMLPLTCMDGTPYVRLVVVGSNGQIDKEGKTYGYPEALPMPCSNSRVISDVEDNPTKYYSILLSAAIINGTLE